VFGGGGGRHIVDPAQEQRFAHADQKVVLQILGD